VTWPPTMIVECGESSRTMRHISRTLPTLTMIEEMPTTSYSCEVSSRAKPSRVGKSRTVQGAEMLAWISMMPRSDGTFAGRKRLERESPDYGTAHGMMARLPNSSSCAYGPKTELRSTRARVPLGWVTLQLESCGFIDKK